MDFLKRARLFVEENEHDLMDDRNYEAMKITVEYLLKNAKGEANAISINRIRMHLRTRRHPMGRGTFQHNVLGILRDNVVFIGASRKGLFLIVDKDDAEKARGFYVDRIAAEEYRLKNLDEQITEAEL